ncbi:MULTISPECIES: hypothetical protein [unclassified Neisseria]|uniref:hypothetical protein n=1 Tax=unclassified Neisseria TaxID=2623750 RepID=UPI002665CCCD|nr:MULTISPECIES: hypothetical protein [unclassified Neisseria]MDO1510105.1 hypothetical protein [Neisseria sp. MVDL19-042950]MDO1516681.1 hypothetical protein [Neisseria sp. MVDL18-041461]MDO1563828.1 hypothetical protein [Neisseria sp. MVDL20-010259]
MKQILIAFYFIPLLISCSDNAAHSKQTNFLENNNNPIVTNSSNEKFNAQVEEWNRIFLEQDESLQGNKRKKEMLHNINTFLLEEPNNFQALSVRMRMFLNLKHYPDALQDLQKINQLKKDGILKFSECILNEKLGTLDMPCYQSAINIYSANIVKPESDLNYLLMLYMKSPEEARTKLENLENKEKDPIFKEHINEILNSNRKDIVNNFFEN